LQAISRDGLCRSSGGYLASIAVVASAPSSPRALAEDAAGDWRKTVFICGMGAAMHLREARSLDSDKAAV